MPASLEQLQMQDLQQLHAELHAQLVKMQSINSKGWE